MPEAIAWMKWRSLLELRDRRLHSLSTCREQNTMPRSLAGSLVPQP
jgi:hypothetical protein